MTNALRTRAIRAALDTTDSAAIVTAAAATGLTTYRALHPRPAETRITAALAAGALAALIADRTTYRVLAPLRRRFAAEHHGLVRDAVPAPTPEQLSADLIADAAQRAASGAARLDYGLGSLTKPENWAGAADGTATCEITATAHLLSVPRPSDRDGYSSRSYLLVQDGGQPTPVHSIGDLVVLLDHAKEQPADLDETCDPWAAIGQDLAIAELLPTKATTGDTGQDDEEHDIDQEAEAHAAGLL
ncbi:hypothetical protein [Streptomyces sp. NRRL B-24484]|uniref:hypothetical protein n=1 Tax=Streptomyces sp. NRRL B-24484 TaxID=1463833 RepID=UPI0004C206FC|nr:hypothetical protein [Streptomyces sp. NRRL B-24484]